MLRNGNLGPTRAENGGLSRGTYPICIYRGPSAKTWPPALRGPRRPECSQDACYKSAPETYQFHATARATETHFHAEARSSTKRPLQSPTFFYFAVAHTKMWVEVPPPPPERIVLFPNRLAMARVLCLWRSIEKKGLNPRLVGR